MGRYHSRRDGADWRHGRRDRDDRDDRNDRGDHVGQVDDLATYHAYEAYDGYDDYDDDVAAGDRGEGDRWAEDYPLDDSAEYRVPGQQALAARPDDLELAPYEEPGVAPMLIPGTGISMGFLFIRRRARPLNMRIATLTLVIAVIVTGLLSVTPLGAAAQPGVSSFEALSGAVVLTDQRIDYFWYTARLNDTIEQVAATFHVQVGGILEMNGLCPSQGLAIGKRYKIPTNSQYGADYASHVPAACASLGPAAGYGYYGQTTFGTSWWDSYAGIPTEEGRCSTNYGPNDLDFKFISPNWNSSWVRGFTFYHDGVDISAPQGNPVHAVQAGQIIWAGYDATNGFGWSVVINHCYHVASLYGHMMGLAPGIKAGVNVSQGQVLGYEGMTGWATGPHVHLTIMWNNVPVNPMLFYHSIYDLTHDVPNS